MAGAGGAGGRGGGGGGKESGRRGWKEDGDGDRQEEQEGAGGRLLRHHCCGCGTVVGNVWWRVAGWRIEAGLRCSADDGCDTRWPRNMIVCFDTTIEYE